MKVKDFIARAKQAASMPSVYATGCWGWPLNYGDNLERIIKEWPNNQKPKHEAVIRERATKYPDVMGWDCINLVKGIIWSWAGDPSKEFGGAVFESNECPDVTVSDFWIRCCTDHSTDWSKLVPGEFLYYGNGSHCGIYVGDGLAVEATGSWDRTCTYSVVENIAADHPEAEDHLELDHRDRRRTWQAHGRIKFVEYEEDDMTNTIICPCCGAKLTAQLTLSPAEDLLDIYTVQDGDSPWSIAVKYYQNGTLYYKIMDYNGLARNAYIYTGQQLKIPRV